MGRRLTDEMLGTSLGTIVPKIERKIDWFDLATLLLLASLVAIALLTFHQYAISNDEGVQHHYGQLILEYYRSGLTDQTVFGFRDLYLYGGLFDIIAVKLGELLPFDPYDIRHVLCALIGIAGVAATALAARMIAGARAGLIAAVALSVTGCWYGAMFNHTKDIPLAAAMMGASCVLLRLIRELPRPPARTILLFGLLTGVALGMRVLGLLLVIYAGLAILVTMPWPSRERLGKSLRFIGRSAASLLPALVIAYLIMIAAWPWAALAPLNPLRGLIDFAELHYHIRTILDGQVYEMASVPRLYVPIYILVRVPLLTLIGALIALLFTTITPLAIRAGHDDNRRRDTAFIAFTVFFPLACQVIGHGPAFTGLRHFLFVLPPIAVLAGIGIDATARAAALSHRHLATAIIGFAGAWFTWNASMLLRLHPYEYLSYNRIVGGLPGASGRYATDYWVNIMPEAVYALENYLNTDHSDRTHTPLNYTVAVCGERVSFEHERYAFEKRLKASRLRWMQRWTQADFFIAPTHMNCDKALDGKIIATIERLGVPIGYVKDRRAITRPAVASIRPSG